MTSDTYAATADTYSQLDHRLVAAVSFILREESRADRIQTVAQYLMVYAVLDRMIPKKQRRNGSRPHELVTNWTELKSRSGWLGSLKALRDCIDFAWRHYLYLPFAEPGASFPSGIRILRLDHARHGLLRPLARQRCPIERNGMLHHARSAIGGIRSLEEKRMRGMQRLEKASVFVERLFSYHDHCLAVERGSTPAAGVTTPVEIQRMENGTDDPDRWSFRGEDGRILELQMEDVVSIPKRVRDRKRGRELWQALERRRARFSPYPPDQTLLDLP